MATNFTRNTEVDSRESEERTYDTKEYIFEETDALHIPQAVKDRFKRNGFGLRWIRISLKNEDDYMNVGKKQREGWEFVTQSDVPELTATSIVRDEGRYEGAVCRGDVALAKAPLGMLKAREDYHLKKTRELMEAVNSQLERASDSKIPISNSSKSSVQRTRSFAED
jgi:hypothetical protein